MSHTQQSKRKAQDAAQRVDRPRPARGAGQHCQTRPQAHDRRWLSRAAAIVTPEHQEERERVLAENLDRIAWQQKDWTGKRSGKLDSGRNAGLLVRTYYVHIPGSPPELMERWSAASNGSGVHAGVGRECRTGQSMLERMPQAEFVEDAQVARSKRPSREADDTPHEELADAQDRGDNGSDMMPSAVGFARCSTRHWAIPSSRRWIRSESRGSHGQRRRECVDRPRRRRPLAASAASSRTEPNR